MNSKSLWLIGLVIIIAASFVNGLLIQNAVGGIAREGMRLIILIGIGIFVFGVIKAVKKQ